MKKIVLFWLFAVPVLTYAQSNNAPSSYDPHEIKITGYLQTQFQKAQSEGITSFSAGDFDKHSNSRFMIRRGRLKIDRVDEYTSVVFQLDATQDGVRLMDAFIQLNHPGYKPLKLTAGLFNRPFGYSIVYSSGYRDFPERARVFQTLMPRERDLGAMLSFRPQDKWNFLSLDFAVINGSGLSAKDYDNKQDYVGNVSFTFDSLAQGNLHLAFGGSIYQGSVRNNTATYFTPEGAAYSAHTDQAFIGKHIDRKYFGANLQLEYRNHFGTTSLKAEYVMGDQPGVASSEDIKGPYASQSFSKQPATDLYQRSFSGSYIWLTQEIGTTGLTAIAAYDIYDPNNKAQGLEIGTAGSHTTAADIKYSTLGYGLTYQLSKRLKVTAYNEHVNNEKTGLEKYTDDLKDNVFTARIQYRW